MRPPASGITTGGTGAWLLAVCGAPLCTFAARGATAAEPNEKRILFIGNSYTGGMRAEFGKLIRSEKVKARAEYICPGGRTLLQHAKNPKVAEKIRSRKWDYVVLQEQSQTPAYFRDRFRKGAEALNRVIGENGSKAAFYMTWGRRDGDKKNRSRAPDYETMQKLLTESYQAVGRKLGIRVAPVGRAWQEVRKKNRDLWKALYRKDGSHPSAKGAYLISLVFHCFLFERQPADVRYTGALKQEEARVVKEATAEVLKN